MRIVIINAVYGVTSTGRTYAQLQKFLISRGHECLVIYGNNRGHFDNTMYMGNLMDHKCHALMSRITGKTAYYSKFFTGKLLKFLDSFNPDLVHLGNLHGNFINVPMLLKYLGEKNIATTVTLHNCWFFTGGCTYYTLNNCYKWEEKCEGCSYFHDNNSWFFDRASEMLEYKIRCFNNIPRLGVIGVSEWISDEAKGSRSYADIKEIQNQADMLVHVESFKLRYKLEVRMSFSTKIIDYRQTSKCILAVGPKDVASIKYLKDNNAAYVIYSSKKICENLEKILTDTNLLKEISCQGQRLLQTNHGLQMKEKFYKEIESLCIHS